MQTVAELCLSPVGLSATTRLAPRAFASQAMALWFLGSAAGQAIAAQLIQAMVCSSDAAYYLVNGVITLVVAGRAPRARAGGLRRTVPPPRCNTLDAARVR